MKKLDTSTFKEDQNIETCLGGGYGKGCCALMAIALIRCENDFKEPRRIEFK